jgi:hypothetical protein
MEKETNLSKNYAKDALRSFVPALTLVEAVADRFGTVEDMTWFYVWKTVQPGFRALFSPQ